jgi:hypothetical protein
MGRRWDGTLAVVTLGGTLGVVTATGATVSPTLLILGGAAAVVLELLSQRAVDTVRDYWSRPLVQAALLMGVAVTVVATAAVRPALLWALVGGLCAYLLVLGIVAVQRRRSA